MRLLPLLFTTALLTLGLAGCGQKGPLYLPQPSDSRPASEAAQPQE